MSLNHAYSDLFLKALCTESILLERLDPATRQSEVDQGFEDLDPEETSRRADERKQQILGLIEKNRAKILSGFTGKKAKEAVETMLSGMTDEEILLLVPQMRSINSMLQAFKDLPPEEDMAAASLGGAAKRGWYKQSAKTISDVFGPDTPRFVALLASTSPNVTVAENLRHTVRIWEAWDRAGRPRDEQVLEELFDAETKESERRLGMLYKAWKKAGSPNDEASYDALAKEVLGEDSPEYFAARRLLNRTGESTSVKEIDDFLKNQSRGGTHLFLHKGSWINNAMRALTHPNPIEMGQDVQTRLTLPKGDKQTIQADKVGRNRLAGDKVESFRKNLLGDLQAVTNDTWIAQYGGLYQEFFGNKQNYAVMASLARRTARRLNRMEGIPEGDPDAWTPAEVQETVWSLFKAMSENIVRRGESWPEDIYGRAEERAKQLTDKKISDVDDFATSILRDEEVINALRRLGIPSDRLESLRRQSEAAFARSQEGSEESSPWQRFEKAGVAGYGSEIARRGAEIKHRNRTDKLLENPTLINSKVRIVGNKVVAYMTDPVEAHNLRVFLLALSEGEKENLKPKVFELLAFSNGRFVTFKRPTSRTAGSVTKGTDGDESFEAVDNFIKLQPDDAISKIGPYRVTFNLSTPPVPFKPYGPSLKEWKDKFSKKKKPIRHLFKAALGAVGTTNNLLKQVVEEKPQLFAAIQPSLVHSTKPKPKGTKFTDEDKFAMDSNWLERHEPESYAAMKARLEDKRKGKKVKDDTDKFDDDEYDGVQESIQNSLANSVFFDGPVVL